MEKKLRQPVTKGRAKVPVIMQLEELECGAACLAMILAYYRKWLPLERVRVDCGVSRDGSNALNIAKAARTYGMEAKGRRCKPGALRKNGPFPCMIHWNFDHFVVLCGFSGNKACINDPARGSVKVSMEEFDRSFTGICVLFAPGPAFEPGGKRKSTLEFVRNRLKGTGAAAAMVILSTMIACLFRIMNPAFSRFFMDRLLTRENPELLGPFIAILAAAAFLQLLVGGLTIFYSTKINAKMDLVGSSSFLWKVLRLPMQFFSQRMPGDILQRQGTNAEIAGTILNTFIPQAFNLVMLLVYLIVMIRYNLLLTLIGIGTVVLNLFLSRVIARQRINITRVQKRDEGKLISTATSGIRMIETIKASGAENGFFQKWAGYQASVNAQTVRLTRTSSFLGMVPSFLASLANSSVLVLGVWMAMKGEFTIGMIMTFQGFMGAFMAPAADLTDATRVIQEMRTDMERIDDVMNYPSDPLLGDESAPAEKDSRMLSGEVELRHVSFGYSRLEPPLIEDFSMHVKAGSRVAFVGASGCGKSTLSRLITGLYRPWSGEILFDGKPVDRIDRDVFTSSVAVVDQDIILFEDTIANNIRMWNSTIEDFSIILASKDAQVYDDIMAREGGFGSRIREGGRDLSGGQRQRLEIARVLAQDPSLLIMDEATSALDAKTEYELMKSVKARGVTCIVIAHRLSTIRDCDEIIVLENGKAVERGTHEELLAMGGLYADLVAND